MNPFRKNKNKIDSKYPTDGIKSKNPSDDDKISTKTPPKEEYFPSKEIVEPPKVNIKDFNPPPKKSRLPEDNSGTNLPSNFGKTNEDSWEDNSRSLPKDVFDKKQKEEQIPSSIGKSDTKRIKDEGKSLPIEAIKQKEKEDKKPVSYGGKEKDRKGSGKNNPLPKEKLKDKSGRNKKSPSTAGAFKEKDGGNKKIPKYEKEQKIKDKKPPATFNVQTKVPKDKKPKDEIPKERILSKNPK